MAEDYYEILGVAKDASENDIKKAFRLIARECHPDVAGDDPEKAERFKRAREAWETLGDAEAKEKYDRRQQRAKVTRAPGATGSFFDAMWKRTARDHDNPLKSGGPGFQGKPVTPGAHDGGGQPADSRSKGTTDGGNAVDLDDLFAGGFGTRAREAARPKKGKSNVDIGEDPTQDATWHRRDGSSQRFSPRGMDEQDPYAPRRGEDLALELDVPESIARSGGTVSTVYVRLIRNPRWVPGGSEAEVEEIEDVLDVRIIRGTQTGEVLQERGKGSAGTNYGPYGDLYVTVRVVGDPVWSGHARSDAAGPPPQASGTGQATREDGVVVLDVSIGEAVLGGRVEVETPAGRVRVTIPPGTSSGTRLRLTGKGPRGADLYVETRIVVPTVLDEESRALIAAFAERNAS